MPYGILVPSCLTPDNTRNAKVLLGVFYKNVMKMAPSAKQQKLSSLLERGLSFCTTLHEWSREMAADDEFLAESRTDREIISYHKSLGDFVSEINGDILKVVTTRHGATQEEKEQKGAEAKKETKKERIVIVNVAQHEVNQEMMKMTESYYQLQETKKILDAKAWDLNKASEKKKFPFHAHCHPAFRLSAAVSRDGLVESCGVIVVEDPSPTPDSRPPLETLDPPNPDMT